MAIPEFILRKLIQPGSLKPSTNGFQFVLLNTFAPATIISFSIKVGNEDISPSDIKITPENGESFLAIIVNKENPMATPVGQKIAIDIRNHSLKGPVKIFADTKEIGALEFSLAESIKKPRYKKFKPLWSSAFRPAIEASVKIDDPKPLGQASPFLLGQFVEHLERCVYDGIWTKDGSALRQDTLKLIQQLKVPMIRYPGGNFASGYHWEDGIGPKTKRPARHDAAWQAEESNQVGTDEFLTFCEQLDIEPYLVVNDGSGTPEEAARWVAYCNDPQSTEQGQRRATNGHQSPYNVKYWGIGNEVWGPWQIGTTSAKEYSGRLKRFTQAMKAIDPSIKIIAVGNNPLSDSLDDSAAKWNKEVLNDASEEIDFLSWHIYQPEQDSWKESYDPLSLFASVCAAPLDIDAIIQRVGKEIDNSKGSGRITQCIDEWNIWLPPGKQARSMHQVTYTMRDALYIAGVINVFFRNFKQVDIGNLAQLVNVLPLIQTNQTSATATAIYYPFELAAELEENVLAITTNSPMFNSQAIGVNVQFHTNVPYLDAVATQDEEGDSLTFLLTNRHPENRMNVNIQLPAGLVFSSIITKEIKAASPLSFNSFSHPYAVRIHSHDSISISGNNYQVKMSPASIMLIRLEK